MKKTKKLEEQLIEIGLKIAKRNDGALFVIGKVNYNPLVEQQVKNANAFKNPKLIESLALMDGAIILNQKGDVKAYGVMIKGSVALKNYGTRHAAGVVASKNNNTVILVSEEDKKVKIFKNGKIVMQIDALQKNVEKTVTSAVNILESIGAGTVGTIGTTLLMPTVGIALLPGIIVFGGMYYISKGLLTRKR